MRPGAGLDEASVAGAAEYGDAERYELSDKGRVEPGGDADGHVLLPRRGADALYGRLHLRVVDLPELAEGGREVHRTDDERVDALDGTDALNIAHSADVLDLGQAEGAVVPVLGHVRLRVQPVVGGADGGQPRTPFGGYFMAATAATASS